MSRDILITDTAAEVERLRSSARWAIGQASEARTLALEIDGQRLTILDRDNDCLMRHTADVWSSSAASRSRATLRREVSMSLWMASEGLREVMAALERRAVDLDDSARSYNWRADQLETQAVGVS